MDRLALDEGSTWGFRLGCTEDATIRARRHSSISEATESNPSPSRRRIIASVASHSRRHSRRRPTLAEIGRRAGNHAQDFTRGRLLLQRFLEFLEQPDVLDGNYSLVGEGFEKRDLLVRGEGPHLQCGVSTIAPIENTLAKKTASQAWFDVPSAFEISATVRKVGLHC